MEFEGDKFAKNVQIKQEMAERQHELEELKQQLNSGEPESFPPQDPHPPYQELDDPVMVDVPEQELGDLILDDEENENDKKKYIILGLALLLLFVLTVLIIKLMGSFDDAQNSNSLVDTKQETISQDQALNNDEIEKQYQNIIKKKMEEIKQEESAVSQTTEETTVDTTQPTQEETVDSAVLEKKSSNIIEKLKAEEKVIEESPVPQEPKKVVKQVVQKPVVTDFAQSASNVKPTGVFVQIGAFSKEPNKKFMDNITANGYSYKLYSVEVRDKTYVKVLIGPYGSTTQAKDALPGIKTKLNANSAYVIKF